MAVGSFVLVLHGHLPYVLKHGRWPHGEHWLFEVAAETWMPLLGVIDECLAQDRRFPVTLGLTPVLLEQLAHDAFKGGFVVWLDERIARASRDEAEFRSAGELHLAYLAGHWREHYQAMLSRFEALDRDLPAAFARHWDQGGLELLSSNATHGYMPLLLHDASCQANLRLGLETSERILGRRPRGIWLPECAYRPGGSWTPPVLGGGARLRKGTDQILADEGVEYTFLDSHLLTGSRSEGVRQDGEFHKVSWEQAGWDHGRGWRSPLEPHLASSDGGDGRLSVFARHPKVSEQVWSGEVGYPGDGRYLEFHKRHGQAGLRYWKVTGRDVDLGDKAAWHPDDIPGAVHGHAQHFAASVRALLTEHREATGRHGVVVASFDAELFGHWWHEGVGFLRDVMLALQADPQVDTETAGEFLDGHPPDKVCWIPEGSWGAGGDHRVWLNEELRWTWEVEYRAEERFGQLCLTLPWQTHARVRGALERAGRELLLLQASDWQFVIHTRGAQDYGLKRFALHATRFDRMCEVAEDLAAGKRLSPVQRAQLSEVDTHDDIFPVGPLRLDLWDTGDLG